MPRFQFSLRALMVATTLVAIAAATLPLWVHWLGYVIFFAGVAKLVVRDVAQNATLHGTIFTLLTLSVPVTLVGVLGWALVAALREKRE